jgi:hypothetical protein
LALALVLLACLANALQAAQAVTGSEVLATDLAPLIDSAVKQPTRFAVNVPHVVSLTNAGKWTDSGNGSSWTYAVRVPTAVSLSFHASQLTLPANAVLTVTGANGISNSYHAGDVVRGGLWGRPLVGDSLTITLSVPVGARSLAALRIDSFQAGYRGLRPDVPDNAYYRSLIQRDSGSSGCTVNFSCAASSANQGPANATVAVLVGNQIQCTGTLLNDTSEDGTAYILTARHCENGELGGGNPAAAATVTIYWDAVSSCGATLGSIYDGTAITQSGATTMVEQQDAWLLKLDAPPAANDAYYSGWDAGSSSFSGGYSIHHALGNDKQYVSWFGAPIVETIPGATLQINYASTFLGVVNQTGNVGAGASGGALFNSSNNAVGSLTQAQLVNGLNSAGVCPVANPPAPSPSTVTALYTSLSSVWSSSADSSSTTGNATLQSVLDAAGTGKLVFAGTAIQPVTLSINYSEPQTGVAETLGWSAPGAQSCTASGGLSGDGWAGPRPTSGTFMLTEQTPGAVTWTLVCTGPGTIGYASTGTTWSQGQPLVDLSDDGMAVAGGAVTLTWFSTVQPCTASGGTPGDGWAGTKSSVGIQVQSIPVSVLGSTVYTLTCGTGSQMQTVRDVVPVTAPVVSSISGDANQLRIGQPVNLQFTAGGSCAASGGAAGDGWAGPLAGSTVDPGALTYTLPVSEAAAGTYTYTVTCTGAGATAGLASSNSITLTFTGAAATATLSAGATSVELDTDAASPTSVLNLSWSSNQRPCAITYVGPGNVAGTLMGVDLAAGLPAGTAQDDQLVAGSYVYTLSCGTGASPVQSTAAVTWFTTSPTATLVADNPWPQNSPDVLHWSSNVYPCTASGGAGSDGWSGSLPGAYGYQSVTETALGPVTFNLSCGSGAQLVSALTSTTVVAPVVSISASTNNLPAGSALVISWNSNFSDCSLTTTPPGQAQTNLPANSGFQTTELIAGTYTYAINCAGVQAATQATFTGSQTTLTASATSVAVGTPITLSWSSPREQYLTTCTLSGGTGLDGWSGTTYLTSGTQNITSGFAGTITYSISCNFGDGPSVAQTQVTYSAVTATAPNVPTPATTLRASVTTQDTGSPVTLTWTSQNANACAASGGASGDGWSGALSAAGSMAVTESAAGSVNYGIVCSGAAPAATATATVMFTQNSVTITANTGSSAGKSGGGAVDLWSLLVLAALVCRPLWQKLHSLPPRSRGSGC